MLLALILAGGLFTGPAIPNQIVNGTISATSSVVTASLDGYSGASVEISSGVGASFQTQWSFDGGNEFQTDQYVPPMSSGGLYLINAIPAGATHLQVVALTYGANPAPVTITLTASSRGPSGYAKGTLINSGDTVVLPISGAAWATARVLVGGTVTTSTVETSIDNGVNWYASGSSTAYAKRVDAVSANPSLLAFSSYTAAAGSVWELPLAANATHIRVRAVSTGGPQTVTLSPGTPYVPGVPVAAVLYEVTSAANTVNTTGQFDGTGWSQIFYSVIEPAGGIGRLGVNSPGSGALFTYVVNFTAAATWTGGLGPGTVVNGATNSAVAGTSVAIPRKFFVTADAVAALTTSIIVEARR